MISFKNIKDNIDYRDYNALVYLLRKFKKLSTSLQIGANDLSSDYGDFHFSNGFESIGSNFILNNDVTITSDSVLRNAHYTFIFTVLDVNLSGNVNRRLIEVTGSTGENSQLNITVPSTIINNDEVILPDFKVDVTFDMHEYYTPKYVLIDISADKLVHSVDDPSTITVNVKNINYTAKDVEVTINDGNGEVTLITDRFGKVEYTIGQISDLGRFSVLVTVEGVTESIELVNTEHIIKTTFKGMNIDVNLNFPKANKNNFIAIDWGDYGSCDIVYNNSVGLSYNYNSSGSHDVFIGVNVTDFSENCFKSDYLEKITLSNGFKRIESGCFDSPILNYVELPASIEYIASGVFRGSIAKFYLGWENVPIDCYYDDYGDENTIFYVYYPYIDEFISAGYPQSQLIPRLDDSGEFSPTW